jgi:hypothetical protein
VGNVCTDQLRFSLSAAGSIIGFDETHQTEVVYSPGDIAWVLASTALVWIMIPGVGFFYSGLLRYVVHAICHFLRGIHILLLQAEKCSVHDLSEYDVLGCRFLPSKYNFTRVA